MDTLIEMAAFANRYLVYHLKNQISDVICNRLHENPTKVTPSMIRTIYSGKYLNSTLRQLCSLAFIIYSRQSEFNYSDDHCIWKPVFNELADFGWDYFQHTMECKIPLRVPKAPIFGGAFQTQNTFMTTGGSCCFRDHSDVADWEWTCVSECLYPQGPDVELAGGFNPLELQPEF
jgi:hypothetical protein